MHEMSVAMEVCRIVEVQVGAAALPRVREVGLIVGHQSGVEPENLRFCLDAILSVAPFQSARSVFEMTPGDDLSLHYLKIDDDDPPN